MRILSKNSIFSALFTFFFILPFSGSLFSQSVFINEFMASNGETLRDEDGDYEDWIEIYNAGDQTVHLKDYGLTDDPSTPFKWIFPETAIAPGEFLIIWASGKDRNQGGILHTQFRLSADGEFVGLFRPDGEAVDSLTFGAQKRDISWGRLPDGTGTWGFRSPTPGKSARPYLTVIPSSKEGIYSSAVNLSLSLSDGQGEIRFTLDGYSVKPSSPLYTDPIYLWYPRVLRAAAFINGEMVTPELKQTYIINMNHTLPVLSMITEPANLWDQHTGIYENPQFRGEEWEREAWLALFENGTTHFSVPAGIRIHGRNSRYYSKKGFRIYFRSKYGLSRLKHQFFDQKPELREFKRLILHASSADQATGYSNYTYLSDPLSQALFHEIGGLTSMYKPVILYINGSYWGLYWIRERIDKYYVETNFNITNADLLKQEDKHIPHPKTISGNDEYWNETIHFINSDSLNIQTLKTKYINIKSYIDYHLFNFFIYNWAWPDENVNMFRDRDGDPRWQWILYDNDVAWKWDPHSNHFLEIMTKKILLTLISLSGTV